MEQKESRAEPSALIRQQKEKTQSIFEHNLCNNLILFIGEGKE